MRKYLGLACGTTTAVIAAFIFRGSPVEIYLAYLIGYLTGMKFAEEEDA